MFRNKSASAHNFAMIPRADVPRSSFTMQKTLKTAFDAGYLIPIFCEEVLPGDTFNCKLTAFARLATPIFPVMDNLHLETFFFFVPNRLVWANWRKFMGEQDNPSDSISYTVPVINMPAGGAGVGTLADYFGVPVAGQVAGANVLSVNALPFRAYNLIYNQWFRDENLQQSSSYAVSTGDGPDSYAGIYGGVPGARRGKRHDYFTSCLPWTQKGATAVSLPLGTSATVKTSSSQLVTGAQSALTMRHADGSTGAYGANTALGPSAAFPGVVGVATAVGAVTGGEYPSNLYADLSTATAATINAIRLAFQTQRLLERDARGGTRYTEMVRAHFGVISPDARLQRPEYLGGSQSAITINPIAQTSGTSASGTTTPLGNLAAMGQGVHRAAWTQSFTEHGYVIGLANVRADLTYQQGLRRHWKRSTRYDFYLPVFANLGEQGVLNQEIYCDGSANDTAVFGYQERWAEYRYNPSEITGLMRSTAAGTIDPWHLSQKFTALPTLNDTFIQDTPPLSRILAVGSSANGQQLLFDAFYEIKAARPMPMYSVPGLVDHF